jgi:hypothetical protein
MKNNKQSIGDLGQHWTPNEIVDKMISLKRNTGKTLEPSAGSGRFVNKIKDITAIEIDKNVVPSDLLSVYNIINFFDYPEYHKFDTVIGNPPYVAGNLLLIEWFSNWKGVCPRTANSYLHFIDKCINHLSENGEIIFIIPSKGASQQGLFYTKITFFTHSATYFWVANKKLSVILHTFYIIPSQMRYAAAYPASSSMASRTVSAENRNTPLPVYTST